uniref:Macaca fascicularis brain cDNA clone: QflA-17620, similar to human O-acyltransferase (membrane bound) domain containing 1(OACT1), mRNA, RefSeq: XM_371801.2 n=1 Tax=Macaca fascicularis TaxID=9541 RepID=I7GLC0_MACFA|nr:unnamed protein product [Macaca fascicularis]
MQSDSEITWKKKCQSFPLNLEIMEEKIRRGESKYNMHCK